MIPAKVATKKSAVLNNAPVQLGLPLVGDVGGLYPQIPGARRTVGLTARRWREAAMEIGLADWLVEDTAGRKLAQFLQHPVQHSFARPPVTRTCEFYTLGRGGDNGKIRL